MYIVVIIFRIILAAVMANVGKNRSCGSTWAAVLTFILGLIGIIIVFCCKKNDSNYDEIKEGVNS